MTVQLLVKFTLTVLHMNNFPCSKAGMTSLFLVKERIVNFCHTHKQVKVKPVKENLSRKTC
jgi:hypothetical protein